MTSPLATYAANDDPVQDAQQLQMADDAKTSTGVGRSDSKGKAEYVDDSTITDNVKKAIERDPQIANQKVDVKTKNGVVTVSGSVNDERFKGKIIQVIQSVPGVRSVQNDIKLGNK